MVQWCCVLAPLYLDTFHPAAATSCDGSVYAPSTALMRQCDAILSGPSDNLYLILAPLDARLSQGLSSAVQCSAVSAGSRTVQCSAVQTAPRSGIGRRNWRGCKLNHPAEYCRLGSASVSSSKVHVGAPICVCAG